MLSGDYQRDLWRQLDALLAQRAPTIFKTLNGPASAIALDKLTARGANEDLIATYALHDGADRGPVVTDGRGSV